MVKTRCNSIVPVASVLSLSHLLPYPMRLCCPGGLSCVCLCSTFPLKYRSRPRATCKLAPVYVATRSRRILVCTMPWTRHTTAWCRLICLHSYQIFVVLGCPSNWACWVPVLLLQFGGRVSSFQVSPCDQDALGLKNYHAHALAYHSQACVPRAA